MTSTPISADDASMTSGTQTPLSSHPSKKFRVSRSGSKRRVAICSIRRRPDSVFSRRGTDTPVQIVAPFSDSVPQTPLEVPVSRYSSKRWIMGRSKQPELRGCVLRAVPKAAQAPALPSPIAAAPGSPFTYRSPSNPLSHAHVDATMATSPNEEILSNIGQSPAPTPSPPYFPSVSPSLPPKKGRKERKSEGDAGYIGVWKDGKAHWEAEVASMPPVPHLPDTAIVELDSRPIRLETPVRELPSMQKDKRPRIQVIIPNDLRNRAPHARPPFVSQAVQHSSAGEIISSRDVSPPLANDMIQVRNSAVSPIAHQILTHRQQTVPVYLEQVDEVPVVTKHPSISSSSGMSTSEIDDSKSSVYTKSNRTSWTSIDDNLEPGLRQNLNLAGLTASKAYSIVSPTEAGIFDDATPIHSTSSQPRSPVSKQNSLRKDKPLPPEPQAPSIQQTVAKLRNSASTPTLATRNSIASRRNTRRNQRVTSLPARGLATGNGSVPHSDPPSPTLSEAETALEEHLSCILENSWDDVPSDHGLGSSRIPSTPAPVPPRKSSRRKRVVSLPVGSSANHIAAQQVRPLSLKTSSTSSSVRSHGSNARGPRQPLSLTIEVPSADLDKHNQRTNNTSSKSRHRHKRSHARRVPPPRVIAPDAAEHVILGIFERIDALKDLFSLARVNRGFYRVFKRHELRLIRTVLQNECPPAWEHRESTPPYDGEDGAEEEQRKQQQHLQVPNLESAHPEPEHTATTFYRHHMRDARIIGALKSLVLTRCQSFLRPETVMALASSSAARAARIDKAFWRIWTFCTIFGCGKGREDDIVGQMDWLRGGPLVHQTSIRATIMTSDSFDASSALLNASEHFAKGNGSKGLSAEELYDMTEIWTCMGVLISALEGRTEQAREFGVFEMTDVRGGDIDGEEKMLQEWIYYVSTLGLSVVLELANAATKTDPDAFILALENGWMDWSPPQHNGSRRTFLKEAVARVYEEKIAAMAATTPQEDDTAVTRQVQAQRMAAHKAEIQMRRRTGDYALVRMSMERPMSEWEGVFNRLDNSSSSNESIAAPQPRRHVSTSSSVMASAPTPCPAAPGPSIGRSHSELIALPPMPEQTTVASSVAAARHTSLPVPPTYVHHQQMQERMNAGGRRGSQQNPLLQTLAHAKQYDYGVSASPTEQHPALRSTPSSSSFRGSETSSRRGSTDSGVSPVPAGSSGRLFSEEAVHPAFRNAAARPQQHHSPVSQSRQPQQQPPPSSNSSVSSMSATAPSPNMTFHQGLPPSYSYAQQQQQQQQQAVKHSQNTRYYSQHHHNYHHQQHPPAHPAYPYSAHRHGSIASQPPPPPSSYQQFQYQQQQQQQAHQRHHSLPASYSASPSSNTIGDPLPAHRHRVSTQHPFQQEILSPQRADPAANSADKAIFRIVEMGFTADEAKMALRRTDAGDGLRVDRAVEFLLSR